MRKVLKATLGVVLGCVVVFIVLEGLASTALFWRTLLFHPRAPLAEKGHTRYDPELGWVNTPNVALKDYYGPGLDLTTNAQGFRGTSPVPVAVPPGMFRIICSGDSMTLGYGVRDDQTWCQALASLDPRLEAVNMGQGGYGVDQAYLWFRRDGARLDHQVHIFAFIVSDFNRMQSESFYDYQKPVLVVRNGSIVVTNTPVPKVGRSRPWLQQNLPSALEKLATFQVASRIVQPLGAQRGDLYAGRSLEDGSRRGATPPRVLVRRPRRRAAGAAVLADVGIVHTARRCEVRRRGRPLHRGGARVGCAGRVQPSCRRSHVRTQTVGFGPARASRGYR